MTTMTDSAETPKSSSFRLSMLLNDTRFRSLTFQFIALVAIIAFMAFVGGNLVRNLAEAGLNISFKFLGEPAGYDINQRPIQYDSQASHGRAAVVGLLNTLIVAFLACLTATVFGVVAGVLRLSNNWLVAKIMSFYVEIFRNVPVLIWILIIFSIMINTMPPPKKFKGAEPEASMFLDLVAFTNRGVFAPSPEFLSPIPENIAQMVLTLLVGILMVCIVGGLFYLASQAVKKTGSVLNRTTTISTLVLVVLAFLFIKGTIPGPTAIVGEGVSILASWLLVLATLVGSFIGTRYVLRSATKTQNETGVRPTTWYINLAIWVLPVVIVLFALGLTWSVPVLKGFNFKGGMQIRGSLIALWFALAIYTGAFIAENVRAGILAISKGQTEAAGALGIRPNRIMSLVILPQALRVIIPPLISNYLNITKNSSLAIAVGYMDVTGTLGGITLLQTGRAIETVLLLMLFYLIVSLLISAVMNVFNNRMKLQER